MTDDQIGDLWKKWVGTGRPNYSFARAVWQAAINHERSECAKVCEDRAIDPYAEVDLESRACAAAIRARS
jgi:hypothetical protein